MEATVKNGTISLKMVRLITLEYTCHWTFVYSFSLHYDPGHLTQYAALATDWDSSDVFPPPPSRRIPGLRQEFFCFPKPPHQTWTSPSLLFSGFVRPFPQL
jgi:hypothetical protein